MAYQLLTHASAGSSDNANVTTGAIDTTGATLLVLALTLGSSSVGTGVTDNKSNTWHALTVQGPTGGGYACRLFYAFAPTVGTGHTASYSEGFTDPALALVAYSGATAADPFDVQNGAFTSGIAASLQPGSVTPSQSGDLAVTAIGYSNAGAEPFSIDSGFTIVETVSVVTSNGLVVASKIKTDAAAENPTWSFTGFFSNEASPIATFKTPTGVSFPAKPRLRPRPFKPGNAR